MEFDDLIVGLLNEPDIEIRRYYPDKLAKLGDWRSTEYLGSIMNNENEPIILRIECAESLGKQGSPQAIHYLKRAILTKDHELRRTSVWSLGQIGTPETAEIVMNLRNDENENIKKWVVKSLGRIENTICLKYLDSIITENFEEYQAHLNLIIISVTHQLRFADVHTMNVWNDRCYEYLTRFNDVRVQQACLKLQNYCFESKLKPKSHFFIDLLQKVSKTDQLLRPYILMNIAYGGDIKFLEDLELDVFVVKALSKSVDQLKLIKILDHHINFASSIIEEVLNNLIVQYNCSIFFDSENEGIKYATLQYYARRELKKDRVFAAIKEGKRINFVLSLLKYFPTDSLEIIKIKGNKGSKAERQTILKVLENIDYLKHSTIIDSVLGLLEDISHNDQIWHIRRDARILNGNLTQFANR